MITKRTSRTKLDAPWTGYTVFIKEGARSELRVAQENLEEWWAAQCHTPKIVADLMGHFPVSPDGFRFLWVGKRLKTEGFTRKWYVQPLKDKTRATLREAYDQMEVFFGLKNLPKLLKFDREGALLGQQRDRAESLLMSE